MWRSLCDIIDIYINCVIFINKNVDVRIVIID